MYALHESDHDRPALDASGRPPNWAALLLALWDAARPHTLFLIKDQAEGGTSNPNPNPNPKTNPNPNPNPIPNPSPNPNPKQVDRDMPRRAAVIRRWIGTQGCDDLSIQLSCNAEPRVATAAPGARARPAAMARTCAGEQQVVCTAWRRQAGGDRHRHRPQP